MLKALFGGGDAQKEIAEFQALLASAKEERGALSALLTQVSQQGSKLATVRGSLEQVENTAVKSTKRADELAGRLEKLEEAARTFGEIERRVQALLDAAAAAQQTAVQLIAPDGEVQRHRQAVQQLSSQALETQASLDALKREREVIEEVRGQLRGAHEEVSQTIERTATVRAELEQTRGGAGQLSQELARLRDLTRETREESAAASNTLKELDTKLGPLMQLQELSKATDDKLAGLSHLAEHVAQKAKALDAQKVTVERAVVEANRLNEMVWSMEVQIAQLNEGLKQAAKSEDALRRVEALVGETNARVDAATKVRDDYAREASRFETDGRRMLDTMRAFVEKLTLDRTEFEAFDQRLRILQGAVTAAETQMDGLAAREKHFAPLTQKVDGLSKDLQGLTALADELSTKQASLESLHERLGQVETLSARTAAQHAALGRSREDLDLLRKEIQEFQKTHAAAAKLRDGIAADRQALQSFSDRMAAFMQSTPQIEASADAINAKLGLVDEGMKQATRLGELASELGGKLERLAARSEFVHVLEARVNELHEVTVDVDRRMVGQLDRRSELEALKSQCDGVVAQMLDAQQKVTGVAAIQGRLLPMVEKVATLDAGLQQASARLKELRRDDAAIVQQEARLAGLVETARSLAQETAARLEQAQSLSAELSRSASVKDELLVELARVQARQREAVAQVDATEDQLRRTETLHKQLEQRRTQMAFAEKKVIAVDVKVTQLSQTAADLDQKIKSLTERESAVAAVKAEIDTVHQISARSRADLLYVSDRRDELADLRTQVERLLMAASDTEARIAVIDGRRREVEEVEAKANLITNLLDDLRINLEMLGEHKTVVDHVAEQVAGIEFATQEAQTTLRKLQHERALAERIEESVRQLRLRAGLPEEGRRAG